MDVLPHAARALEELLASAPFKAMPVNNMHVSVIYSRKVAIDNQLAKSLVRSSDTYSGRLRELAIWGDHNNASYVVGLLDIPSLSRVHQKWLNAGAVHDYRDFTPHITLSRDKALHNDLLVAYIKYINLWMKKNAIEIKVGHEKVEPTYVSVPDANKKQKAS